MVTPREVLLRQNGKGPALVPSQGYPDDAGYDLYCAQDMIVWPFSCVDIETGWDIKIPNGFWGSIQSRSSTFKRRKLFIFGGVIDCNYTGKLSILVWNPFFLPKRVRAGERLAQLIIHPYHPLKFNEVTFMPSTTRGNNSFGSSGT